MNFKVGIIAMIMTGSSVGFASPCSNFTGTWKGTCESEESNAGSVISNSSVQEITISQKSCDTLKFGDEKEVKIGETVHNQDKSGTNFHSTTTLMRWTADGALERFFSEVYMNLAPEAQNLKTTFKLTDNGSTLLSETSNAFQSIGEAVTTEVTRCRFSKK